MPASVSTLRREVKNLKAMTMETEPAIIQTIRDDPARIMATMTPDPWQAALLRSGSDRILMLCSRQSGKSLTAAALALRAALLEAPALVLLLSPTLRQSGELFRDKVLPLWHALGSPYRGRPHSQLALDLTNGSRIISLPGEESNIRGFSGVGCLIIDEAARVGDPLYFACRPMLAVSRGRLVCLSSAYAKQGFFFTTWTGDEPWRRVKITAYDCPRITREFLEEERRALGARWFSMEYECVFGEAVDAVFRIDDIHAALNTFVQPLFGDMPS